MAGAIGAGAGAITGAGAGAGAGLGAGAGVPTGGGVLTTGAPESPPQPLKATANGNTTANAVGAHLPSHIRMNRPPFYPIAAFTPDSVTAS